MKKFLFVLLLAFVPFFVHAQATPVNLNSSDAEYEKIISNYKSFLSVSPIDLVVPTVVEVNLSGVNTIKQQSFLVYDKTEKEFIASLFLSNYSFSPKTFEVKNGIKNLRSLNDDNYSTSETFTLLADRGGNEVVLDIVYQEKIKTNQLILDLDKYVSLPSSIKISYYKPDGSLDVILSDTRPTSGRISFPEVTTDRFVVSMKYAQPLRILELSFNDLDLVSEKQSSLRFLAKADHSYDIYFDRENYVKVNLKESPNLSSDKDVKLINYDTFGENVKFVESDVDGDGIIDKVDNCVNEPNTDQVDIDNNNRGDVCDDFDRDGVINSKDNCPDETNRNQADIDGDDIGDACDQEESRITEKYPIIVWGGIILALLVFVLLYLSAIRKMKKEEETDVKIDS